MVWYNILQGEAAMKRPFDRIGGLPMRLSFADQARFAAETIRRVNANGRFDNIDYGGGE